MIRQDDKIKSGQRYPAYGLQQRSHLIYGPNVQPLKGLPTNRGCPMPDSVRFFHIPHDQVRADFLRQLQPNNHRIRPVRKRNILIERFPDGRPASLYRIFTTDPIERGGSDTLLFRRVPDRLSSEKGWIRISHHIDAIQIGGIKEIIHQSMMIRMQACRHTVIGSGKSHSESWDEKQPSPNAGQ